MILKKTYLFILLLIILIPSCLSVDAYVKAQIEDVPVWVYDRTPKENQELFFIKYVKEYESIGFDEIIKVLILEIENVIGYDLTSEQKKEFKTTKKIDQLGIVIEEEYIKKKDNIVEIYVLASGDKKLIKAKESKNKEINIKETQRSKALLSKAKSLYRDNKDLESAKVYLELGVLTEDTSYYEKIKEILRKIEIKVTTKSNDNFDVYVKRKSSWIDSNVSSANIEFSFLSYSPLGKKYLEKASIYSDNNGYINFSLINQMSLKQGELKVSISFDIDKITSIRYKKEIQEILNSKTCLIPYKLPTVDVNYNVKEYSKLGEVLNSNKSFNGFSNLSNLLDIKAYYKINNNAKYNVIGKVGISDITLIDDDYITSVIGESKLYDNDNNLLFDTKQYEALGIAKSKQESIEKAFERYGTMLFVTIKPYLK